MYAKLDETGDAIDRYPYTFDELFAEHPNTSFPSPIPDDELAARGVVRVVATGQPEHDRFADVPVETTPTYSVERSRWEQAWNLRPLTDEERAALVPAEILPLQGLLAIDQAGLSGAYEAWSTSPARTFAERAFIQRAPVWRRDDPLLQAAAAGLGMTAAQLDNLFCLASTL